MMAAEVHELSRHTCSADNSISISKFNKAVLAAPAMPKVAVVDHRRADLEARSYRIVRYVGVLFTSAEVRSAGRTIGSGQFISGGIGAVCRRCNENHHEPTRTSWDRGC